MVPELRKQLRDLYEELLGANFACLASHDEFAEIYRIRLLNKLIVLVKEHRELAKLAYLAQEAKLKGDLDELLQFIEGMLG